MNEKHVFNLNELSIEINGETDLVKRNITEFTPKEIVGSVQPKNVKEVEKIIRFANDNRIPLYPYSSGMNWGQGSKVPTCNNALLVDLSGMNNILEINTKHRYVIVEPGVTQQQLSTALEEHGFKIPVTGSAKDSSVMGNMLERGATFFGHRNKLLMGVESVLGNGSIVRTGLWHFHTDRKEAIHYHPQGVGPDLNGAFTQSNFGIVTKIVLRILPKTNGVLMHAEAKEAHLADLIDTLYSMWEDKLTRSGIIITNKNDPRTTDKGNYTYVGDWFVAATISGASPEITQAIIAEVKKRLAPLCYHLDFLPTEAASTNDHPYFSILNQLYEGKPTNYSLETMASMRNVSIESPEEMDVNKDIVGFSVALPAVPFDGEKVMEIMSVVKRVSDGLGVQPFHNFGSIDDKVFEGFYRIYFDRKDRAAVAKAHLWNNEVHLALREMNIFPYRINIERMKDFTNDESDSFWQMVKSIKSVLDPNNIIAPGRYAPS